MFFTGLSRTFDEISAVSTVDKKEIQHCKTLIKKAYDTNKEIITPCDFMNKFCNTLGLSNNIQQAATAIANRAVDLDLVPGQAPEAGKYLYR